MHDLRAWEGHVRGAKVLEQISRSAVDLGIQYLTAWVGSYDNLTKRTPEEINTLDKKIYGIWGQIALRDKLVSQRGVRVRFIGEWPNLLSLETQKVILALEEKTKDHSKYYFTYLIGYNGDREMAAAINAAIKGGVESVNVDTVKKYLWTKDLPPVDLVIRTGEENPNMSHNSNGFMMWHTRNSLFYHTKKYWPDFTVNDLKTALGQFSQTERRFGK
jgi:undecaprenyl diphosphate synthase